MVMGTVNLPTQQLTELTLGASRCAFAERLKRVGDDKGIRSISDYARLVGISVTSMRSWLRGENDPSRENLIRIAVACSVNVEWLATGDGPMAAGSVMPQPHRQEIFSPAPNPKLLIDPNKLSESIRHTTEAFDARGVRPTPAQISSIAVAIYDHLSGSPETHDPASLARILTAPWVDEQRAQFLRLQDATMKPVSGEKP